MATGELVPVQVIPVEQAAQAVKTCPSVPTDNAAGVLTADAARMAPFAVYAVGATTQAVSMAIVPLAVIVPPVSPEPAMILVTVPDPPPPPPAAHFSPPVQVESAVRT